MNKILFFQTAVVVCLFADFASGAADDPLDQWHQLNTDAGARPTQAMAYGQGRYLGLNDQHELLASTDARQWAVTKTFSSTEFPSALAFADGFWVLGGNVLGGGVFLLTSADGAAWDPVSAPAEPGFFYLGKIRHTPEGWRVLSSPGLVESNWLLQSNDGRTWTWSQADDPGEARAVEELSSASWVELPREGCCCSERVWPWEAISGGLRIGIMRSGCSGGPAASFAISTDGRTWVERYLGTDVNNFTLSAGRLIVITSSGSVVQSDPLLSLQQTAIGDLVIRRAAGMPILIESSQDLLHWQVWTNLPAGEPIQNVSDPVRSVSARFYRAKTP